MLLENKASLAQIMRINKLMELLFQGLIRYYFSPTNENWSLSARKMNV